jgi:hypothetical protein
MSAIAAANADSFATMAQGSAGKPRGRAVRMAEKRVMGDYLLTGFWFANLVRCFSSLAHAKPSDSAENSVPDTLT